MAKLIAYIIAVSALLCGSAAAQNPNSRDEEAVKAQCVFVLSISQDGSMTIGQKPVAIQEIAALAATELKKDSKVKIYVDADPKLSDAVFLKVMNVLGKAGVKNYEMTDINESKYLRAWMRSKRK